MADIRAFHGIRYNASRFGRDVSNLVCPPYDVISTEERDALYARDPHNAIRLELTRPEPTDASEAFRYRRAADDFAAWQSAGVLTREPRPALYAYAQQFTLDGSAREHDESAGRDA